jgi:hypothetical protein
VTDLDEIRSSISSLHQKLDKTLMLLEAMQSRKGAALRGPKPKPSPLTQEDITALQAQFAGLYERWLNEDEFGTKDALEQLDPDQLRRLADANNLNVTSKMSKEKVLQLIGARFREKRQLHMPTGLREKP